MTLTDPSCRRRRIARWSKVLSFLLLAAATLLPVAAIGTVALLRPAEIASGAGLSPDLPPDALPLAVWIGLLVTLGAPALLLSLGMLRLRGAFESFSRGAYFAPPVFRGLRGFAELLAASAVVRILAVPLAGLLLSSVSEEGSISIRLGSPELLTLLVAGCVWTFAWLFEEAAAVEAENREFV